MSSFALAENSTQNARIVVFGVGGGGGNAVENMLVDNSVHGVEFVVINTDVQALQRSSCLTTLQIGEKITRGLGAGADPSIGRQSAEEDKERLREYLEGADMIFITAGMGGGTGTGAAPVVAQVAKEMGILTVAVVTKPFSFEGKVRTQVAEEGIRELSQHVDSLITIPNNKLLSVLGKNITLLNAFKTANNILLGAVQGIADLITRPGLINVDFADVRTVMSEMGMAMMGTGVATGDNRAVEAAEAAISSPLLDDINLSGARGILVNITAGPNMSIGEFEQVGETVKSFTTESATVVVGTVIDPDMRDEFRVTVVITGLGNPQGQPPKLASHAPHIAHVPPAHPAYQTSQVAARQAPLNVKYERPQTIRTPQPAQQETSVKPATVQTTDRQNMDYLDIPAFLRGRQTKEETAE